MVAVKFDPLKIAGPWSEGYVLERQHTLSAEFLGHDSSGHAQFDTKYSELGELIFRLKNRNDRNTLDSIAGTAVEFLKRWGIAFDLIVPMPQSRKRVAYQPVPGDRSGHRRSAVKPSSGSSQQDQGHAATEGRI